MKKLLVTTIVILEMANMAGATIFEPEWTEFCPPTYCFTSNNKLSKDAQYWYKRRIQFEKSLAKCAAYEGTQLNNCYSEVRAAEERKNKVWDVRQDEKYRRTEYNREYNMEQVKYNGINRIIETIKK